ncbi:MAG: prepilin-type N-terminal cleavage/methylation domain-containing protein [Fimbriimonadaceae bacterium]|nr:prepilin-type N-terminal cleavage/methylation domain-containing protein [Fimbriimonadaceae bacterium]
MKRTAFTLIELLVVIAIIAILAAILFPVFSQAKAAAKKAAALSNGKQMTTAFILYANDYEGVMPIIRECSGPNLPPCIEGRVALGWMDLLQPYVKNLGVFKDPADGTRPVPVPPGLPPMSAATNGIGYVLGNSELNPGGQNRSSYAMNMNLANNIFVSSESSVQFPASTILVFSFAPNSGGGIWKGPSVHTNTEQRGAAFNIIRDPRIQPAGPGCTPGDLTTYDPTVSFFPFLTPDQQRLERAGYSSTRHNGGAIYGFVDGHAKFHRPQDINGQCSWVFTAPDMGNDGTRPDFRL